MWDPHSQPIHLLGEGAVKAKGAGRPRRVSLHAPFPCWVGQDARPPPPACSPVPGGGEGKGGGLASGGGVCVSLPPSPGSGVGVEGRRRTPPHSHLTHLPWGRVLRQNCLGCSLFTPCQGGGLDPGPTLPACSPAERGVSRPKGAWWPRRKCLLGPPHSTPLVVRTRGETWNSHPPHSIQVQGGLSRGPGRGHLLGGGAP